MIFTSRILYLNNLFNKMKYRKFLFRLLKRDNYLIRLYNMFVNVRLSDHLASWASLLWSSAFLCIFRHKFVYFLKISLAGYSIIITRKESVSVLRCSLLCDLILIFSVGLNFFKNFTIDFLELRVYKYCLPCFFLLFH